MEITKEAWRLADDQARAELQFDLLQSLHLKFDAHIGKCETRFCKLEKRKKIDTVIAGGAGAVAGFLAHITGWFK